MLPCEQLWAHQHVCGVFIHLCVKILSFYLAIIMKLFWPEFSLWGNACNVTGVLDGLSLFGTQFPPACSSLTSDGWDCNRTWDYAPVSAITSLAQNQTWKCLVFVNDPVLVLFMFVLVRGLYNVQGTIWCRAPMWLARFYFESWCEWLNVMIGRTGKDSLMICNIRSKSSTNNEMNYVYTIHPDV